MSIAESDWKLYRKKVGAWQEAYIGKLCEEYVEILSRDTSSAERFWEIEKRIKRDKRKAGVIVEMRRSAAVSDILRLIDEGAIIQDDLEDFSDDLKEAVKRHLEIMAMQ